MKNRLIEGFLIFFPISVIILIIVETISEPLAERIVHFLFSAFIYGLIGFIFLSIIAAIIALIAYLIRMLS